MRLDGVGRQRCIGVGAKVISREGRVNGLLQGLFMLFRSVEVDFELVKVGKVGSITVMQEGKSAARIRHSILLLVEGPQPITH